MITVKVITIIIQLITIIINLIVIFNMNSLIKKIKKL